MRHIRLSVYQSIAIRLVSGLSPHLSLFDYQLSESAAVLQYRVDLHAPASISQTQHNI